MGIPSTLWGVLPSCQKKEKTVSLIFHFSQRALQIISERKLLKKNPWKMQLYNYVVKLSSKYRKKTVTKVTVFFQRCVPQAERDVSFGSEVRFAREVCLRHEIRNTSHHCEHSEQHHYAKHNITLA